jgi:hypothetical protein
MGHANDAVQDNTTPQQFLQSEWNLPSTEKLPKEERRMRLIFLISDAVKTLNKQTREAGTHWSVLICDIQASKLGLQVQYRHFDSVKRSGNFDSACLVATQIQMVSNVSIFASYWYLQIH